MYMNQNENLKLFQSNQFSVEIFGLGYVGFPLAIRLAKSGLKVKGIDVNPQRLERLLSNDLYESELNLKEEKEKYLSAIPLDLQKYIIKDNSVTDISYPVIKYPSKIPNKNSLSFQKDYLVEGKLMGIKGQYLMLDNDRVFNVRKHEGYIIDCLF